nr:hypothetical protein [Tanacetum cinerariifolium]
LIVIPTGDLVPASGCSFLLVAVVTIYFCWSCDFLLVASHSCWSYIIPAGSVFFLLTIWGSASEVSLPDGVKGLLVTIDGNAYIVTEASIWSALQLDDLNAIDTLTNAKNFDRLRAIGYATEGKFMFFKNKFSPQWKFLIHTLIHCLSPKSGSWNQFASNITIALICLSTRRKYNFSNLIFNDLLKVCRALTMSARVLNCSAFKLEEIVMAIMICLKSSVFTTNALQLSVDFYGTLAVLRSGSRLVFVYLFDHQRFHSAKCKGFKVDQVLHFCWCFIPAARVFCSCCHVFIAADSTSLLLLARVTVVK